MEGKYNPRSPAVKRLMKEAAELSTPTSDYQVICTKLFLSSGIHPKVKII